MILVQNQIAVLSSTLRLHKQGATTNKGAFLLSGVEIENEVDGSTEIMAIMAC